jgi:TonB family protein
MNTRFLCLALATTALGLSQPLRGDEKPAATGTGYTVLLELKIDEKGAVEDATVVATEDTSADHILDQLSMDKVRGMKLEPRVKDGQPVKYTVKAPFIYAIDGDQPEANLDLVSPKIHKAVQPAYPAELAAKGEVGGVILEAVIGVGGNVKSLTVMRSTNPAFAAAATAAVNQWYFTPAMKDGVAVESRWRLSIAFATDVRTPDWKWRFAPRPSLGNYTVIHPTLPPKPAATEPKPATPPAAK